MHVQCISYNVMYRLTSGTAIEVGKYSEQKGGRNGDGITSLLQHLLISLCHLHDAYGRVVRSVSITLDS